MDAGCHVFMEKPIATTDEDARRVVAKAREEDRKLVLGYILRHHPSWAKLVEIGRTLGKPLVMRMNLNQQSSGPAWNWHKNLMQSLTPLVDCGVHYVDIMCQLTSANPVRVHGIGAQLTDQTRVQNYGHLHVVFDDGSVGWYEAGWGPMMSEVAYFVKDVVGPKGCVSIVVPKQEGGSEAKLVPLRTRFRSGWATSLPFRSIAYPYPAEPTRVRAITSSRNLRSTSATTAPRPGEPSATAMVMRGCDSR